MADEPEIVREEDRFTIRAGEEDLGHLRFRTEDGVIVFEHTEVDESLRGQGKARELLETAVAWLRDEGLKAKSECPYVTRKFDEDDSYGDVLAD